MLVKVSSFLHAGSSLQKIFVQLNFFSVRSSAYKEGAVIQGSMALSKWPEVLHLCLDSPATLSAEEVTEGLLINNKRYRFNGLLHDRGDGVWNVSVNKTVGELSGWNLVDRGSVRKPTTSSPAWISSPACSPAYSPAWTSSPAWTTSSPAKPNQTSQKSPATPL